MRISFESDEFSVSVAGTGVSVFTVDSGSVELIYPYVIVKDGLALLTHPHVWDWAYYRVLFTLGYSLRRFTSKGIYKVLKFVRSVPTEQDEVSVWLKNSGVRMAYYKDGMLRIGFSKPMPAVNPVTKLNIRTADGWLVLSAKEGSALVVQ